MRAVLLILHLDESPALDLEVVRMHSLWPSQLGKRGEKLKFRGSTEWGVTWLGDYFSAKS